VTIDLQNLSPVDMSQIGRREPVTFDLVETSNPYLSLLHVRVKFANRTEELLVYDGTKFVWPFHSRSTISTFGRTHRVTVAPAGPWEDDIDSLEIVTVDSDGAVGPLPEIPTDNGILFPQQASHWNTLNLAPADLIFDNDGIAAGNLTDLVAGAVLTAVGSPGYDQAMPGGFTRTGVRLTASADGYFTNAADFNPGTGSFAVYMVIHFTGSSGFSIPFSMDGSTSHKIQMRNSGQVFGQLGAQITDDIAVAHDDGVTHGILLLRNVSGNSLEIHSDLGSAFGATAPSTDVDAAMTLGAPNAQINDDMLCSYLALWKTGTGMESFGAGTLTTLGW
jgi:hypothetical protein